MSLTATQQRAAEEILSRRIANLRVEAHHALDGELQVECRKIREDRQAEWVAQGGTALVKANRYFRAATKKFEEHASSLRAQGVDVPPLYVSNPFEQPSQAFRCETEGLLQKAHERNYQRQHKVGQRLSQVQGEKHIQILEATLGDVENLMDLPSLGDLLADA